MSIPVQHHMPRRRSGHTTAVTIGGERFYLTANQREDGTLGEVFIQWGKQGTTGAGLMDIYAIALSVGLQHQVPLPDLIRPGLDLYFVPNGHTDDPEIPRVRSVIDYIARRLAIDWLPGQTRASLGIFTLTERVQHASEWITAQESALAALAEPVPALSPTTRTPITDEPSLAALRWELATGIGSR
jgi:ribonucleoside-diphosphate reductase alpha chain